MISLKQLREVSGLSQKEVCYRTDVSPTRLSLFENKQGELTAEEQEQVCKRIISLSAQRAKYVRESSRVVQLTESSRSNSRANSNADQTEATRTERRKKLLIASGMPEEGLYQLLRSSGRNYRLPPTYLRSPSAMGWRL
jgi:transcriptional regulator with XRE-family HTH domain